MDKVDVYWLSYHKEALAHGYWDNGLLDEIFAKGNYQHHYINRAEQDMPRVKDIHHGGIVIINGRMHIEDADKINEDIASLYWCLFIDTGDEEAVFPWRDIKHPRMRVWIMMPRMNQHDDTSFKLPNGYRPNTKQLLSEIGQQTKEYDVFFAGQVNHARREQCVEEVRKIDNAVLVETQRFGEEKLEYKEYLTMMARSKIVLCPSGVESPDNFRLYEALEAGCLPVVDAFATNNQAWGFWQYLFGNNVPFPIVNYWDELPQLLPTLLREYPHNANKAFAWWQNYKRKIKYKLIDDIRTLQP